MILFSFLRSQTSFTKFSFKSGGAFRAEQPSDKRLSALERHNVFPRQPGTSFAFLQENRLFTALSFSGFGHHGVLRGFPFGNSPGSTGINRNPLSLQNRAEFFSVDLSRGFAQKMFPSQNQPLRQFRFEESRRPPALWATQGAQYAFLSS
jgi:hypothetical protein